MGTYSFVARIYVDNEPAPYEVPLTHSASSLAEAQDMLGQAFGGSMRQGYLNFTVEGRQFVIPSERISRIEVEVVE